MPAPVEVLRVAGALYDYFPLWFYPLIPNPIDQNPFAHWRKPMDMMRQG